MSQIVFETLSTSIFETLQQVESAAKAAQLDTRRHLWPETVLENQVLPPQAALSVTIPEKAWVGVRYGRDANGALEARFDGDFSFCRQIVNVVNIWGDYNKKMEEIKAQPKDWEIASEFVDVQNGFRVPRVQLACLRSSGSEASF